MARDTSNTSSGSTSVTTSFSWLLHPAEEMERLWAENRQLRQALASHAAVDQAIGVLTILGQIPPCDGFTVLREVSQHTNIKLTQVAEQVLKRGQGAALPGVLLAELHAALARHAASRPV